MMSVDIASASDKFISSSWLFECWRCLVRILGFFDVRPTCTGTLRNKADCGNLGI
jgi:hypothetical protein